MNSFGFLHSGYCKKTQVRCISVEEYVRPSKLKIAYIVILVEPTSVPGRAACLLYPWIKEARSYRALNTSCQAPKNASQ